MTPANFAAWLSHMGWSKRRAARELDCSANSIDAWLSGKTRIRKSIAYACAALAFGLPRWTFRD
jgi:plasmid maintenance system antidote protein VapI